MILWFNTQYYDVRHPVIDILFHKSKSNIRESTFNNSYCGIQHPVIDRSFIIRFPVFNNRLSLFIIRYSLVSTQHHTGRSCDLSGCARCLFHEAP